MLFVGVAALVLSCDAGTGKAAPEDKPSAVAKPEPSQAPTVLLKICKAYNAEVAASDSEERILARTAVRVTAEYGVSEAELTKIGAQPVQMLAAIKQGGNPEVCGGFEQRLRALVAKLDASKKP